MSGPRGPEETGGDGLWLDGNPDDAIVLPGGEPVALGRDPFAEDGEAQAPDPLLAQLDSARRAPEPVELPRRLHLVAASDPEPEPEAPPAPPVEPQLRTLRRRRPSVPRLSEVEPPARIRLLERLLGEDERRRLAALTHLVENGGAYDRFGLSADALRRAFPAVYALYKLWFRVKSSGHEHIPSDGPVILAANHGGLLPFDGTMGVVDVLLHTDPPRLARSIVERWAGTLPWVNVLFARLGQVIGTRENFGDLLAEGHPVLVFPEGVEGIRKPITQRYRLQTFHVGFIEQALRQRAPVVPMAILGSDDQAPILYDFKPLARRLGLPALPITPTFPWFGPVGLMPYPVPYRIVYGEPFTFHDRFGPEGAEDARLVRYLANQVRRTVQSLVDKNR